MMGLCVAAHRRGVGGRESKKLCKMMNLTWQGFVKIIFTKIEAYSDMEERLERDMAIEEALKDEIKRNTRTQQSVIFQLVWSLIQGKH